MIILSCGRHNTKDCKETQHCLLFQAEVIVSKHNRGILICETLERKLREREGQTYTFLQATRLFLNFSRLNQTDISSEETKCGIQQNNSVYSNISVFPLCSISIPAPKRISLKTASINLSIKEGRYRISKCLTLRTL